MKNLWDGFYIAWLRLLVTLVPDLFREERTTAGLGNTKEGGREVYLGRKGKTHRS